MTHAFQPTRVALWALLGVILISPVAAQEQSQDPALVRTRKMVKMLDDIYKTAAVLITDKYVQDEDTFPPAGPRSRGLRRSRKKVGMNYGCWMPPVSLTTMTTWLETPLIARRSSSLRRASRIMNKSKRRMANGSFVPPLPSRS